MKQKILAAVCALALCAALVPAGFAEQDTAATAPVAENLELTTFRSTSIGGTLSASSANAFNCYIDRDIDRVMNRTQKRPLVTGELKDGEALAFAWITAVASVAWLGLLVNWLSAALSLAAILFYVLIS